MGIPSLILSIAFISKGVTLYFAVLYVKEDTEQGYFAASLKMSSMLPDGSDLQHTYYRWQYSRYFDRYSKVI